MSGAMISYDYLFKLVLVGDSGVGKSCLLTRFAVRERLRSPGPRARLPLLADDLDWSGGAAGGQVLRQLHQYDRGRLCECRASTANLASPGA